MTIRREELRPALALFAILVAHTILETARDALFLARLGPQHLASAYLAMAGCAVVAVVTMRGLGVRDPRAVLIRFLVCATAGTAVLAATIAKSSSPCLPWSGAPRPSEARRFRPRGDRVLPSQWTQ